MNDNPKPGPRPRKSATGRSGPVPLQKVAEAAPLQHSATPERFRKPKKIHPRRMLPLIKEGVEREFHSTSARAMIMPPRAGAADEVTLFVNSELTGPAQQQTGSNVGEPSVAINGDVVFYTGNWYAAMSTDGGQTFRYIDPKGTQQPGDGPGVEFCCDQVVQYIEALDTFVWLLQYGPDTGDNLQRLAFASTDDVRAGRWRFFDLTTKIIGVPGAFLDFPDLAVGENFLYVTTNIFNPDNTAGSAVVRISFDSIRNRAVTAEPFVSMDFQSFRVAQNCGTTAYFAAHQDTSTLAVFSWPESDPAPASVNVGVARWIGGNGYQSRTPDGKRWLDRADPRITGATKAGDELWFAWGVDRNSNQRPRPFIQIARISATNTTLIENINVFDVDSATCYGALSSNDQREVAISYMIGGAVFPTHVVGILTNVRKDVVASSGTRSPAMDPRTGKFEWGDYLTVRRVPGGNRFAASGYTLKGPGPSNNVDATPRFVVFGRAGAGTTAGGGTTGGTTGDTTGGTTTGGTTTGGGDTTTTGGGGETVVTTGGGDGPITDVNALPNVSPSVAVQIKAAAGIVATPQLARASFAPPLGPELVTAPGKERWPVKTGNDDDVALVGKNVIGGHDFGRGIVPTTVEELITAPRPASMPDVNVDPPGFLSKRAQPVEIVIWSVEVTITALKLEADGDYHLVLQGASGETMIGEVPTPTKTFITDSPWMANIQAARQAVDDKLVSKLHPQEFIPLGKMLVPREAVSAELQVMLRPMNLPMSFAREAHGLDTGLPAFKTRINPTRARLTGVGFFDKVHGQMGVSQSNGIELHPVLKVEWL